MASIMKRILPKLVFMTFELKANDALREYFSKEDKMRFDRRLPMEVRFADSIAWIDLEQTDENEKNNQGSEVEPVTTIQNPSGLPDLNKQAHSHHGPGGANDYVY